MADPIPPELIFMPEDVMRMILEECEFLSIQRLRNTCHTIRDFLDLQKPKYHFKFIELAADSEVMSLVFSEKDTLENKYAWYPLYPYGEYFHMSYQKIDEESTEISWLRADKECFKSYESSNFLDFFSRDLSKILECNTPILDRMMITCEGNGSGFIKNALESCVKTPIKVHTLTFSNFTCIEDVMGILPYICADTLKGLRIVDSDGGWDISKIVELDHWKKAEKLDMKGTPVRTEFQNYSHFDCAQIRSDELTMDDVNRVKENFLNSPSITKYFQIYYSRETNSRNLLVNPMKTSKKTKMTDMTMNTVSECHIGFSNVSIVMCYVWNWDKIILLSKSEP